MNELIKKVTSILGFEIIGKKWPYDAVVAQKINNQTITRFPTVLNLTGSGIPDSIMAVLIKTYKPGEVVIVRINVGEITIGDFTILMPSETRFTADNLISIYTRQVGLLLQRRQAEEVKQQQSKDLVSLLEISQTLSSSLDTPTVLQTIINRATHLKGLDTGAIYLIKGDALFLEATTPPLPPQYRERYHQASLADHPHIRQAISTGQPVILFERPLILPFLSLTPATWAGHGGACPWPVASWLLPSLEFPHPL